MSRASNGAAVQTDLAIFHGSLPDWYVVEQQPRFVRTADGWRPAKHGPPDYIATRPARPLSVVFDAKSSIDDRWDVGLLESHQAASFDWMTRVGGIAGVYLRLNNGAPEQHDYWLAWPLLRPVWRSWWGAGKGAPRSYVDATFGVALKGCNWIAALGAT